MPDVGFLGGGEGAPLGLRAEDADDLRVISALVQDAVVGVGDISWNARTRRLALLLHRFRWEDAAAAEAEGRPYERVRSLLVVADARALQADGIDPADRDTVLSLLALDWAPGEDGTGRLTLTFAGDGTLAADCECVNVGLRDVSQPWVAPSGRKPQHGA